MEWPLYDVKVLWKGVVREVFPQDFVIDAVPFRDALGSRGRGVAVAQMVRTCQIMDNVWRGLTLEEILAAAQHDGRSRARRALWHDGAPDFRTLVPGGWAQGMGTSNRLALLPATFDQLVRGGFLRDTN